MPEQVEARMERHAACFGVRDGLLRARDGRRRASAGLARESGPPLDAEGARGERLVVLRELAVGHEDLPEIDDLRHDGLHLLGHLVRRDLDEVPVGEERDGRVDGVARRRRGRLAGPLDLHLRAGREEIVAQRHGCRVDARRREPPRARAAVAEAPAALAARACEDGATRDEVVHEFLGGLDGRDARVAPLAGVRIAAFLRSALSADPRLRLLDVVDDLVDELPAVELESAHVLLDLGRLLRHALGEHEARAAADLVRLDAREVAVAAELLLLGALPVDHDGAVPHDELDLLVRRLVLEVRDRLVGGDLLFHARDLLLRRAVLAHAQLAPDDVRDKDAERLSRTAGRTDGPRERDRDAVGAVVVPQEAHARDPFERRDEDALREDGESRADRLVERLLLAIERAELARRALLRDDEGELLAVLRLRELADAIGHAPRAHELLDTGREVDRGRDLDLELGVEALLAAAARELVLDAHAGLERREVALHLLARAAADGQRDVWRLELELLGLLVRVVGAALFDGVVEVADRRHSSPRGRAPVMDMR